MAIIYLAILHVAHGQSEVIDSLNHALEKANVDTTRIIIMNDLSFHYISTDSNSTVTYASRALELSKEVRFPLGEINAQYNLATLYRSRGYLVQAEDWYRKMRVSADSADLKLGYGRAASGIASIYSIKGQFDEAIPYLKEAAKVFKEIENNEGLSMVFSEYGIIYKNTSQFKKALEYYGKGLKINLETDNQMFVLRNYYNMANVHVLMGNLIRANENYLAAATIANEVEDKFAASVIYASMGEIYHLQMDLEEALKVYHKALRLTEETDNTPGVADLKIKIGNLRLSQEQPEEALRLFGESLIIAQQLGNQLRAAEAYGSMGDAFTRLEAYDSAIIYYRKNREIFGAAEHKTQVAQTLVRESDVYYRLGNFQKAREFANRGMDMAQEISLPTIMRDGYALLSLIERSLENMNAAYQAQIQYKIIFDSLRNDEITRDLTQQRVEFEFQKEKDSIAFEQQKSEVRFEEELKREQTRFQTAVSGGFLILVILALLYRSNRIKQRSNKALKLKNKEISELRASEKQMAEETIALKEREITTITMLSHEKNTLLQQLNVQIGDVSKKVNEDVIPELKDIRKVINTNLNEESWSLFTYHFEKVHPKFFQTLKSQFSSLTQNDLRLCAYVRVGMSNKEIANISNITSDAVKKSLQRMKKKMAMTVEHDLRDLLMSL